jgi:hypothetical protein
MKREYFDGIVVKRAAERVQARITVFKDEINNALNRLMNPERSCVSVAVRTQYDTRSFSGKSRECLAPILSDNPKKGWPLFLWTNEEINVENELLKQLDELQRAILAPDKPVGENEPAPPPATEVPK